MSVSDAYSTTLFGIILIAVTQVAQMPIAAISKANQTGALVVLASMALI